MATAKPQTSLKALAEGKTDGIQKATIFKVRPDVVELEEGFNLREEGAELDEHIERLYHAMKAGAYIPPIDVAVIEGRVLVRDGHCRTRAARRLVAEGIDYQLEARQLRGNDADAVFHMLGSGQGKHFTPLEQGRGFLRLINFGHTVAQIAARSGLHRSTIENGLALAEAPAAVQKLVAEGKVASHTALKVVRKEGGEKAVKKLVEGVKAAEAQGKAKATGKHLAEPKPRGQTKPPKEKAAPTPVKARRADDPEISPAQLAAFLVLAKTVESLDASVPLPPRVVADLVGQARVLVGEGRDDSFGEKCVEFVQALAARSTLVTYQSRDVVQLIEAAFDIVEPKGKK
jgi:ParB family chromosome partitioning protein